MKTDLKSIAIAMDLFVVIYFTAMGAFLANSSLPLVPYFANYVNYNNNVINITNSIGGIFSFSYFGTTYSFAFIELPLIDIVAVLELIPEFIQWIMASIYFLYQLFQIPLNTLPNTLATFINLLMSSVIAISIILSIKIAYSGFD